MTEIRPVDLTRPAEAAAFVELLDHYAQDPMGGGTALAPAVCAELVSRLLDTPQYHGALAWHHDSPIGLINCFTGFSTFRARPLLNIHDLVVHADWRGRGIGRQLLGWAEQRARALGCCKLTLEVLEHNRIAHAAYARAGYAPYALDPQFGAAQLLQRYLD